MTPRRVARRVSLAPDLVARLATASQAQGRSQASLLAAALQAYLGVTEQNTAPKTFAVHYADMLQAVRNLSSFLHKATRESFLADKTIQSATIWTLQQLGLAAKHIPDLARRALPDLPWEFLDRIHDELAIEHYFDIHPEQVWDVSLEQLLPLVPLLETTLKQAPPNPTHGAQPWP